MKSLQPKRFIHKCKIYNYTINIRVYKTLNDMYEAFRKDWEPLYPLKKTAWSDLESTGTLALTQVEDYTKPSCWVYLAEELLTVGVLSHELLHAVIAASRCKSKTDLHSLGRGVTKYEEDFCHEFDYALERTYRKFFNSSIWGK